MPDNQVWLPHFDVALPRSGHIGVTQNPLDEKIIVRHQFVQTACKPAPKGVPEQLNAHDNLKNEAAFVREKKHSLIDDEIQRGIPTDRTPRTLGHGNPHTATVTEGFQGFLTNRRLKVVRVQERGFQCASVPHNLRLGSKAVSGYSQWN